jgi:tRNA G26 N,N-dimethylase Trm1
MSLSAAGRRGQKDSIRLRGNKIARGIETNCASCGLAAKVGGSVWQSKVHQNLAMDQLASANAERI